MMLSDKILNADLMSTLPMIIVISMPIILLIMMPPGFLVSSGAWRYANTHAYMSYDAAGLKVGRNSTNTGKAYTWFTSYNKSSPYDMTNLVMNSRSVTFAGKFLGGLSVSGGTTAYFDLGVILNNTWSYTSTQGVTVRFNWARDPTSGHLTLSNIQMIKFLTSSPPNLAECTNPSYCSLMYTGTAPTYRASATMNEFDFNVTINIIFGLASDATQRWLPDIIVTSPSLETGIMIHESDLSGSFVFQHAAAYASDLRPFFISSTNQNPNSAMYLLLEGGLAIV